MLKNKAGKISAAPRVVGGGYRSDTRLVLVRVIDGGYAGGTSGWHHEDAGAPVVSLAGYSAAHRPEVSTGGVVRLARGAAGRHVVNLSR